MTDEECEKIRELFAEWEGACIEEDDAASKAASAELELQERGINVDNPPDWLVNTT